MTSMQELRDQMADQDPEYRRLLEEHRKRVKRLEELARKGWLTTEEEQEEKRLKKEKLQLKDQMEARLRSRGLEPRCCRSPPKATLSCWSRPWPGLLPGSSDTRPWRAALLARDARVRRVLPRPRPAFRRRPRGRPRPGRRQGALGRHRPRGDGRARAAAAGLDLHVAGQRPRQPGADERHRARGPSHPGCATSRRSATRPRSSTSTASCSSRATTGPSPTSRSPVRWRAGSCATSPPARRVERGERVGLIKFGSRVDLFLPAGASVEVAPGRITRAGVTAGRAFRAGSPA